MAKTIYKRDERKAQFIATGIKLAKKDGLDNVAISAVAKEHKVTAPLIFHIFGTRAAFHSAIKAAAKKQKVALPTVTKPKPKVAAKPKPKAPKSTFPTMPAPSVPVV